MKSTLHLRAAAVAGLFFACRVVPSRTPLGGNYVLPETAPASNRQAPPEATVKARSNVNAPAAVTALAAPTTAVPKADAAVAVPNAQADAIHFEPLKVGSRIKVEIDLSASAEMRGGSAGMPANVKLGVDSRMRAELKVLKASAHDLDEVELTLTTLSTRSEFGGTTSVGKQEPARTYGITLSGPSPTIRASDGSKIDPEERLKIAVVVVPLAEFHAHWSRSPAFELKPGWSSKLPLPFAATLFATEHKDSLRVGPLSSSFNLPAAAGDDAPFELSLPVEYDSAIAKVELELSGSAKLNAKSGRPSAFELSGPLNATGGARGPKLSVTGRAKLSCTFSYP